MRAEHERALAEAADAYIAASEAKDHAAGRLAAAMRAAYADDEQQSAILRAAKHVWSREYLRIVLGLAKPAKKAGKARRGSEAPGLTSEPFQAAP